MAVHAQYGNCSPHSDNRLSDTARNEFVVQPNGAIPDKNQARGL
jgi:hypothetical protein